MFQQNVREKKGFFFLYDDRGGNEKASVVSDHHSHKPSLQRSVSRGKRSCWAALRREREKKKIGPSPAFLTLS